MIDTHKIAWSDKLLIGNELIDARHKRLIELIGSISEHESQYDEAILNEVLEYADTHFSEEEAFMAKIGYPGLHRHRNEHKKLVRILKGYKKQYDEGEKDLYSFKQFMFSWVRDHIMDEDRKIGVFYRQAGNAKPTKPSTSAE